MSIQIEDKTYKELVHQPALVMVISHCFTSFTERCDLALERELNSYVVELNHVCILSTELTASPSHVSNDVL